MAAGTQDHLARAKEYIAQGDSYYAKAADEIIAAQKEDPTLSNVEIARRIGRNESWVRRLVQARTISPPEASGEGFKVDWERGSHATAEEIEKGAKKILADPTRAKGLAPSFAKAMEDAEVAQAVSSESSLGALKNVDAAASTEVFMRKRAAQTPPPADAASRKLGGVGPAEVSEEIFQMSLEPRVDRVEATLRSLKTHVEIKGAHLALTDVGEFDALDERMREIGVLFTFMLDAVDDAKRAKLANEAEGASR
jgi:hypothetical protein